MENEIENNTEKLPKKFKLHLRGHGLVLHKKISLEMVGWMLKIIGEYERLNEKKLG